MVVTLLFVAVVGVVASLGEAAGTGKPSDIKDAIISAQNNIITVKLPAEKDLFTKISLHMDLDNKIVAPQQGGIATVDLDPASYYKDGFWVWQGDSGKGQNFPLKGKPIYYWVRVEESGFGGVNSDPKTATIQ